MKSQTKRAVYVHNSHEQLRYKLSEVESLYHHLDQSGKFPIPDGDLSIAILNQKEMEQLHSDYLQDSSLTDVITFDGDPEARTAGEICVSPDLEKPVPSGASQGLMPMRLSWNQARLRHFREDNCNVTTGAVKSPFQRG